MARARFEGRRRSMHHIYSCCRTERYGQSNYEQNVISRIRGVRRKTGSPSLRRDCVSSFQIQSHWCIVTVQNANKNYSMYYINSAQTATFYQLGCDLSSSYNTGFLEGPRTKAVPKTTAIHKSIMYSRFKYI